MKIIINPDYKFEAEKLIKIINDFDSSGYFLLKPSRNTIKIFELDSKKINIKSFKIPILINKIAYGYFRKSKAQRSFEYANILLQNDIKTPTPIAFFENKTLIGLKESYYVSEQLNVDLVFRELTENDNYSDIEEIIKQYTQFVYQLFEKKIEFIDNTSGNVLIKKTPENRYDFYLVDLNRMNFDKELSLNERMLNLAKLTNNDYIVTTISLEYSRLSGVNFDVVYNLLSVAANNFQERFKRKKRLKKKLFFWR